MGKQQSRSFWSDCELVSLRLLYPKFKTEDVAYAIGRSTYQVYAKANSLGIEKTAEYLASPAACRLRRGDNIGSEYRFQKGLVPWNKGKHVVAGGRSAETRFKAGQRPVNTMQIGSTKLDKSGNLIKKVSDAIGNASKRWRGVAELVWIGANGPIPAKHIVVFKPGMKTAVLDEITLDRVECISLAENMRRNTVHNMPKELAQLVQLRGAINRKINSRKKNEQ